MAGSGPHGQDVLPTRGDPAQQRKSLREKRRELEERADDRISDGDSR